jgi:hypothetical protein
MSKHLRSGRTVRANVVRIAPSRPVPYGPVVLFVGILAVVFALGVTIVAFTLSRNPAKVAVAAQPLLPVEHVEYQPPPIAEPPVAVDNAPNLPSPPPLNPVEPAIVKPATAPALPEPKTVKKPEPPKQEPLPATTTFRRRNSATADELSKQLLLPPEIGLDSATAERLFVTGAAQRNQVPHPPPEPLLKDPQFAGLPVRMGLDCHLGKEASENLQVLSRKLRVYVSESVPKEGFDTRPDAVVLRTKLLSGADGARADWKQVDAIPTLVQILQAEDKPIRLLLVDLLSGLKGRTASAAIAQRALFDLSDEVREAAVRALNDRPREEYRDVLLKGLRYPWAPVADHAAEALVALKDGDSLDRLVDLLDRPDPEAAYVRGTKARQTVVREMVRVNHLKNCVLCHAPSVNEKEMVRGLVPNPKKPVPPTFTPEYYAAKDGLFVRADITYLQQDFAVPQPVVKSGVWPANQRYDYLVRTRPATPQEIKAAKSSGSYPQRESVLFALRELTGKDAGTTAAEWRTVVAKALTQVEGDDEP